MRPRNVLEIGCGTGLLLLPIAPRCDRYCGTDISTQAIRGLQNQVRIRGLSNVSLLQKAANDLGDFEPESWDLVILNSVIQYFPSAEYLLGVIESAARLVRDGGQFL